MDLPISLLISFVRWHCESYVWRQLHQPRGGTVLLHWTFRCQHVSSYATQKIYVWFYLNLYVYVKYVFKKKT